jgi:uncharacterized protein (DUF58 family)
MEMESAHQFHYRIPWRTSMLTPGFHHSRRAGVGHDFRGYAHLLRHPDPRRLDLRASLRDPFENLVVRTFYQRSAIRVYAIADLSASMAFVGRARKFQLVMEFIGILANSVYRTGDAFGFIGCDHRAREELFMPASRRRGAAFELGKRLTRLEPRAPSALGLADASRFLPPERTLVFLISDFHLSLDFIETVLGGLCRHDVVPVVFWDAQEYTDLPPWGLARLRDLETGRARTIFLRPALRQRFQETYEEWRRQLIQTFVAHGREPFFLEDRVDVSALTQYFHQG